MVSAPVCVQGQETRVPAGDGCGHPAQPELVLLSDLQLIRGSPRTLGKDHPISPSSYSSVDLTPKHPDLSRRLFNRISGHPGTQ